jgi:cold shock CspA family protein
VKQGTVVLYHPTRFWGFIREADGTEWFFHQSNAAKRYSIKLGDDVQFEVGPPLKLGQKDQAVNIAPVGVESVVGGGK